MIETESQLTSDCKAAMDMQGKPTGLCGQKWVQGGEPECQVCFGTGGIASASRCPECQQ
jgi:hypothetical protein